MVSWQVSRGSVGRVPVGPSPPVSARMLQCCPFRPLPREAQRIECLGGSRGSGWRRPNNPGAAHVCPLHTCTQQLVEAAVHVCSPMTQPRDALTSLEAAVVPAVLPSLRLRRRHCCCPLPAPLSATATNSVHRSCLSPYLLKCPNCKVPFSHWGPPSSPSHAPARQLNLALVGRDSALPATGGCDLRAARLLHSRLQHLFERGG